MILKFFVDILCGLISVAIEGMSMASLPTSAIKVLASFLSYGGYVVGSDLLLFFCSMVMAWYGIKFTLGVGLFLWRLLPFT